MSAAARATRVVRHGCGVRHRTWSTAARCEWPEAVWVAHDGPWACLAWCPSGPRPGPALTVTLWPTEAEARLALAQVDRTGCGGRCNRTDHELAELRR